MQNQQQLIPVELTREEIAYICKACEIGLRRSQTSPQANTPEWSQRAAKTVNLWNKLKFAVQFMGIRENNG